MADHVFHSPVKAQPGAAADHLATRGQLDTAAADAKARGNHTGTQPTASIDGLQAFVDGRVQTVVDAAPAALDTLNELAAALGDDPNFSATVTTQLGGLDTRLDTLEAAPASKRVVKATIGDAVASVFNIDHGWALAEPADCTVEVVARSGNRQTEYPVVTRPTANRVTVDFGATVPAAGAYRVLVEEK